MEEGSTKGDKATGYRYPNMKCSVTYGPWICRTCGITNSQAGEGVCEACARLCHRGHHLEYMRTSVSRCVCHGHGGCILANCSAQQHTVRNLKKWVCVTQPGEKNRVFDSDQIATLTGKQLHTILGLPDDLALYVQSSTRQVLVHDDCSVLGEYPDIAIDTKPGIYDNVTKCLVIAPKADDLVLLVRIEVTNNADAGLPLMPVGLKQEELDTLTVSTLVEKCRTTFSFDCESCRLAIGAHEFDGNKRDPVWRLLQENGYSVFLKVELSQGSNRKLKELLNNVNSLGEVEQKVLDALKDIRGFQNKAADVFHVNERETIFENVSKCAGAHSLLMQWLFCPRAKSKEYSSPFDCFRQWLRYNAMDVDFEFVVNTDEIMNILGSKEIRKKFKKQGLLELDSLNYDVLLNLYITAIPVAGREPVCRSYPQIFKEIQNQLPEWMTERSYCARIISELEAYRQKIEDRKESGCLWRRFEGEQSILSAPCELVRMTVLGMNQYCFDDLADTSEPEITSLEGLKKGKELSQGRFSDTFLYTREDGMEFSVQTVEKEGVDSEVFKKMMNIELEILQKIRHPGIIRLYGCIRGFDDRYATVTEYLEGGSLQSLSLVQLSWAEHTDDTIIIVGVAMALRFLHRQKFVHNYLSPRHILIDSQSLPRLVSFRYATVSGDSCEWASRERSSSDAFYLAPELEKNHDHRADIFSFGRLVYSILAGLKTERNKASDDKCKLGEAFPDWVRNLVDTAVLTDPNDRPQSMDDVFEIMEKNEFKFWPDIASSRVLSYVNAVKAWENSCSATPNV